jgi:hypothetical protein
MFRRPESLKGGNMNTLYCLEQSNDRQKGRKGRERDLFVTVQGEARLTDLIRKSGFRSTKDISPDSICVLEIP